VTGAHSVKVGYQGGFSSPSQSPQLHAVRAVPLPERRPDQLTQTAQFGGTGIQPWNSYATSCRRLSTGRINGRNRLTLQGGLR
jgi:hypothetical protein